MRARVRALSRVRHPALPPLVAIGEEAGVLKLVEAWVDGETLEDRLARDGPVPLVRGLAILSPVIDALRIAHELGLGHGGIDARSVMIDQVGVPQLVGLGARGAEPADDVPALGALLAEIVDEPWPQTLHALVAEATSGQLSGLADLSERLRLIRLDLPDETDDSPLDDDFDFDFEPDLVPFDEAAVAGDRRVLAVVALGVLAIVAIGIHGTFVDPPSGTGETELADGEGPPAESPPGAVEVPEDAREEGPMARNAVPTEEDAPQREDAEPTTASAAPPADPGDAPVTDPRMEPPTLPPMDSTRGKWRVQLDGGAVAMVVLDAENEVQDRLDQPGRPRLALVCTDDGLSAQLLPGVHRVEAVADEVSYEIHAELVMSRDGQREEALEADLAHGDGHVYLPTSDVLAAWRRTGAVTLKYAPFAADPVVAVFDVRGLEAAVAELGRCG